MMILGLTWLFLARIAHVAFSLLAWPFRKAAYAELQKRQRGEISDYPVPRPSPNSPSSISFWKN